MSSKSDVEYVPDNWYHQNLNQTQGLHPNQARALATTTNWCRTTSAAHIAHKASKIETVILGGTAP